ncbi:MAG: hypothetical protein IPQ06_12920 [Chitinophagaceae bacterium]|nr:hypothetical protein [Chitinophagaceae bacterium]
MNQQVINILSDEIYGIIKNSFSRKSRFGFESLFYKYVETCNTEALGASTFNNNFSGSVYSNKNQAYIKAFGEAIERYCPSFYNKSSLAFETYKESPLGKINPKLFSFFSTDQKKMILSLTYLMKTQSYTGWK